MTLLLLATPIIVLLPTLLYMRLVQNVDRYEKEPARYLLGAFAWGAVPAIIVGVILQLLLGLPITAYFGEESLAANFATTAIVAPVTEEILKGIAVAIVYLWRKREFDGWVDGLVYGATAGFGFAYVENLFYLWGNAGEWLVLFVSRVLVLGFMHGFWTSFTGMGFGKARFEPKPARKALWVLGGLLVAIAAHALHNGAIVLAEASNGGTLCVSMLGYGSLIVLMLGLSRVAKRAEQTLFRRFLIDEVGTTISNEQFAALGGLVMPGKLLPKPSKTLVQCAAELAQKKRQALFRPEQGTLNEIGALREVLVRASGFVMPVAIAPQAQAVAGNADLKASSPE
jgi:RsiW-degrading membrane proteinase PrsW (M82 family)